MVQIIDCKKIKEDLLKKTKENTDYLLTKDESVSFSVILVGENAASIYYLNSLKNQCNFLNIKVKEVILDKKINTQEIIKRIEELNEDNSIDGIMLFLPLPNSIDKNKVINTIIPNKDMDCLTTINLGKFYSGENEFYPTTAMSVIRILDSLKISLKGLNACIIGRSNHVGKPIFELLLRKDITPTICHSKTSNIRKISTKSDILICAIGNPNYLDNTFIKNNSIIIDVGTSNVNSKIVGDFDIESANNMDIIATKVPGGVGIINTIETLYRLTKYKRENL